MDRWIREVDSWDLCDQCCANLFEKTPHAWSKCVEWSRSKREFMKRGGFSLMARLAVVEKTAPNDNFVRLLTHIGRGAADDRNLVKKAVSWALRQIGKRNFVLHRRAKTVARKLTRSGSPHARWVGKDVLRELQDPKVLARLAEKKSRESGR
jgi:3-methyladenine DNA glycosylase AlkD